MSVFYHTIDELVALVSVVNYSLVSEGIMLFFVVLTLDSFSFMSVSE